MGLWTVCAEQSLVVPHRFTMQNTHWFGKPRRKGVMKRRRAKELKRLCEEHTHCPCCGVSMRLSADEIDWEEVRGFPSDPCDDCVCFACGQRKRYPGEAHC